MLMSIVRRLRRPVGLWPLVVLVVLVVRGQGWIWVRVQRDGEYGAGSTGPRSHYLELRRWVLEVLEARRTAQLHSGAGASNSGP